MKLTSKTPKHTKASKATKSSHDPIAERQLAAEASYEASHGPAESVTPVEEQAAPAPASGPKMGDVVLNAATMLTATILEKPELAGSVKSPAVVKSINHAVEEYGTKIAVAALQTALRGLGQRQWVDHDSGKLGNWTCKNVARVDPEKLIREYGIQLSVFAEAARQKEKAAAAPAPAPAA
jgi:hypothetical protein